MSKTSTIPDRKQIQYDRQLRLWGDHGQKSLENGRVCLIGADALGTEILKSLVLPGLGSFTIIDDKFVTHADCGSNFFVHSSMIDQPRARVTCDFLKQLNPDVHGQFIDKPSIDDLLKQNTFDFSSFNVVVTSNLERKILLQLAQILWSLKIPLLSAQTYGFIGILRLQVNEHFVIEAHPDDTVPDLRLDRPLKSFVEYSNSIDLNALNRDEHLHLPSLILLYKTLQIWQKQTQRTDLPRTRQEKDEFKLVLDDLSIHHDVDRKHLENFAEAKRTIPSRLVSTTIPSTITELFLDPKCIDLNDRTSISWFILHAIKLFSENEGKGLLPVRGEIPDMITDTNSYVKLVRIYQDQAKHDIDIVYNYLIDLLTKHNESFREQTNLNHLVEIFCKNSSFLRVIRTKPLKDDEDFLDNNSSDLCWFVGLRVCDLFFEQYGRYPGEFSFSTNDPDADQRRLEIDLNDLKQIGKKFLQNHSKINENQQKIFEELCRYGAAELHSIAAFLGGCCAQETIKLLTHQYVPIDNTLIYNAIDQTTTLVKI